MGTVKCFIREKATRFEVITAKLIYVIMNLYVLWIIASVIFFFLVGSQYGFADLFGSKIITLFGNTMSVPYLLWYFVSMLVCSLPLLFYVAVLVLCSGIYSNYCSYIRFNDSWNHFFFYYLVLIICVECQILVRLHFYRFLILNMHLRILKVHFTCIRLLGQVFLWALMVLSYLLFVLFWYLLLRLFFTRKKILKIR